MSGAPRRHRSAARAVAAAWLSLPASLPAWSLGALPGRLRDAWAVEIERRRLFLWLPVAQGIGILLYFAADREPSLLAAIVACIVPALLAVLLRQRPAAAAALAMVALCFAGFALTAWRTASVAGPILDRVRFVTATGFVETVEARDRGSRIVLRVTSMDGVPEGARPERVRVSLRTGALRPGQHIRARMRLLPPPGPARPGGYDFGRDAFFRGIGAVGSVSGAVAEVAAPAAMPRDLVLRAGIDRARNALTERIVAIGGGQGGAVAAALVTGKRGQITEATNQDLRAAGIYHIVSISGLHMVLAAGTIFWLVRALLAFSATAALLWPIKKIAALAAMAGATAYCVFSGAEVATVRSLIMTLVMLGAILVDRPALSMRNLALAAMIVLALEPEALLGPSFQMSFGAVAALIAFAERWEARRREGPPLLPWPLAPVAQAAIGILVTTILATAATAPFGAYHFQTFNPYGLIGNALALPFVSIVVMPAAVFGVLTYPLGLDWPAWWLMGSISDWVLVMSRWVAAFDRSTMLVPAFGPAALGGFVLALLWITLWTTPLRWLAVLPLACGVLLAARPERPAILIERDGSGLLARVSDGRMAVAGRPSAFVLQQWLNGEGDGRPPSDASLREGVRCDRLGCVLHDDRGKAISYARDRAAVAEDCGRAALVVTPLYWTGPCAAQLIDRAVLSRDGALALYATRDGWRQRASVIENRDRPWIRRRPQAATAPIAPSPEQPGDEEGRRLD